MLVTWVATNGEHGGHEMQAKSVRDGQAWISVLHCKECKKDLICRSNL